LLEQTVLELKGEAPREAPRTILNLRVDLRIPEAYVPDASQRMALYKRASQTRAAAEIEALRTEVRDRYGPLAPAVDSLLRYAALRARADALCLAQVDLVAGALQLRFAEDAPAPAGALAALVKGTVGAALTPQGALRLPGGGDPLADLEGALDALERAARPL
jgi:transcription-repair coupling factor (superfamily II helicase)